MRTWRPLKRIPALAAGTAAMLLLGSCAAEAPPPAPVQPAPQRPAPPPPAPPRAVPQANWIDMPATPGDWTWAMEDGKSVARFAERELVLSCDPATGRIVILRQGRASGTVPMSILTTSQSRPLSATAFDGAPDGWVAASLPAGDSLFDAMAFSRGRFAVEVPGLPTLYLPAWAEVSRVVEDCR